MDVSWWGALGLVWTGWRRCKNGVVICPMFWITLTYHWLLRGDRSATGRQASCTVCPKHNRSGNRSGANYRGRDYTSIQWSDILKTSRRSMHAQPLEKQAFSIVMGSLLLIWDSAPFNSRILLLSWFTHFIYYKYIYISNKNGMNSDDANGSALEQQATAIAYATSLWIPADV